MSEQPSQLTLKERIEDRLHAGPRWLLALGGEVLGVWPVQAGNHAIPGYPIHRGLAGFFQRLRFLFDTKKGPHPLFDPAYYGRPWPPLLHFLIRGGFEGRQPHPLFDPRWYLMRYPDVAGVRYNPLQHYINYGWKENRSPHPLFDPQWYARQYPETRSSGYDPLIEFLLWGGAAGRKPHALFDSAWYLRIYPEVKLSGMNPLVHYLLHGAAEGKNPNPHFDTRQYLESHPAVADAGVNPLSHLVMEAYRKRFGVDPSAGGAPSTEVLPPARALILGEHASKSAPAWRNPPPVKDCPVLVVYGRSHVEFIESHLLPALASQEGSFRLHLHTLRYKNSRCLLSPQALSFSGGNLHGVTDWSAGRPDRHIGFGEAVNYLFSRVQPESCFLTVNPDSLPMDGCIGRMLDTFARKPAAMVEARQWPLEHPKEFDKTTGETPWATGAFLLVSSAAFKRLEGFDPIYFLYNEDVDLSWRAWLAGMPVVYEPSAMCAHFTGGLAYNFHRFQREHFFTTRNFLLLAYKFFGERGEQIAETWIRHANLPDAYYRSIQGSYLALRGSVRRVDIQSACHPEKIKILGMNLYHELRKV